MEGIEQRVNHKNKKNSIVIPVIFNAWRFEKEEHLIIPLLKSLYWKLDQKAQEKTQKSNKVKDVLKDTFEVVKLSFFPIIQSIEKIKFLGLELNNPTKEIRKNIKKYEENREKNKFKQQKLSYESIYFDIVNQISEAAQKNRVKFLFLIDDIDRCLPENSLRMLETMKLFLDIPHCAFVMAIDKEVLELAIKHRYKEYIKEGQSIPITASEYMEKIVTLPFSFPTIKQDDMTQFIKNKYKTIRNKDISNDILEAIQVCVPLNPRKIIRTLELLNLKSILHSGEDERVLLIIALIELFLPQLDREIKRDIEQNKTDNILREFCNRESCVENIDECLQDDNQISQKLKKILLEHKNSRNDFNLCALINLILKDNLLDDIFIFLGAENAR